MVIKSGFFRGVNPKSSLIAVGVGLMRDKGELILDVCVRGISQALRTEFRA